MSRRLRGRLAEGAVRQAEGGGVLAAMHERTDRAEGVWRGDVGSVALSRCGAAFKVNCDTASAADIYFHGIFVFDRDRVAEL